MKITLSDSYQSYVEDRFEDHQVAYYPQTLTSSDEFISHVADAEVLGIRWPIRSFRFNRAMIEKLPSLQFIHATGTGTDWFDVDALTEHGILLANNHGFNASNLAEHALALILLAMRNTHWYMQSLRQGNWRGGGPPNGVLSVAGKTIGIIGMGQSGSYLAKALSGLGARVVAYQRTQNPELEILSGIEWVSFDDLLRESDVVSVHVPGTPRTAGMIGERELDLMKSTAVLVNCARGSVVDEAALENALKHGKLRAAALDVFAQEPLAPDHPILALDNVIATPHIGGQSSENAEIQVEGTLRNVDRFVTGQMPLRLANPEVLKASTLRASHLRDA